MSEKRQPEQNAALTVESAVPPAVTVPPPAILPAAVPAKLVVLAHVNLRFNRPHHRQAVHAKDQITVFRNLKIAIREIRKECRGIAHQVGYAVMTAEDQRQLPMSTKHQLQSPPGLRHLPAADAALPMITVLLFFNPMTAATQVFPDR